MQTNDKSKAIDLISTWKSKGALAYSRRIGAYMDAVNSGRFRGDDDAAAKYVEDLFAGDTTKRRATRHTERIANEAQAKKEEGDEWI